MTDSALCCMNCGKPTEADAAKLFAGVFVCAACHASATHFHEKLEQELRHLLVLSKDSIRVALATGKFHLPEGPSGQPSKRDVLEQILKLEEHREQHKDKRWPTTPDDPTPTQPSTESTPPHVRTLAALGRASSPKGSPQD
jgi:hypothetical protein